jgi:hypothetical protein
VVRSQKVKTPPQQRVPELIVILKSEKDAHKRADAAEELRQFDLKDFPEIIPVLIDALQSDPAPSVRVEAATSLGRLRPFSMSAAQALEKAAATDSNWRVIIQAKTSFLYYQLSGYHAPKTSEPTSPAATGRTDEPPLANPNANEPWWQNAPAAIKALVPGSSNASKPLPAGPPLNAQVPVVIGPTIQQPQTTPQQEGPTLPTSNPTPQPPPPLQWTPVQKDGPPLSPGQ